MVLSANGLSNAFVLKMGPPPPCNAKAGHRLSLRSCVSTCWGRASIYVRFVCPFARWRKGNLCVLMSSRTMLALEKAAVGSELRLFNSGVQSPISLEVNTLASKRSKLIGNTVIDRRLSVIHKRRPVCACVFQLPRVARKRRNARSTCGRLNNVGACIFVTDLLRSVYANPHCITWHLYGP